MCSDSMVCVSVVAPVAGVKAGTSCSEISAPPPHDDASSASSSSSAGRLRRELRRIDLHLEMVLLGVGDEKYADDPRDGRDHGARAETRVEDGVVAVARGWRRRGRRGVLADDGA